VEGKLNLGVFMKAGKTIRKEVNEPAPIDSELLDGFVVAMIDALKHAKDKYAVAEVQNVIVNNELKALLNFVGIEVKQSGTTALFAWTEAVNSTGSKEFHEDYKKEDSN
jgi:RNA 3'-terminal phosphate cyclase